MKKIKIFLGAYVNFPNAQNINCDNIAKYIDKEKFDVHVMYTNKKQINRQIYKKSNIHLHKLIHHRFIWYWSKYLTMLFGNYDIYYLPKVESVDYDFAKKHKDKIFISSIEGVITDKTNNTQEFRNYHIDIMDDSFSISNCIAISVKKNWNKDTEVLPLGVVGQAKKDKCNKAIQKIIWVGNIKANKRPELLLQCAKRFPSISFYMIGDGDMLMEMQKLCEDEMIKNVTFTGRLSNEEVYKYMNQSQLLLMTSEYEGLPKVIQEAAQCCIPSVYINENYTVDFIQSGVNGFAVANIESMIEKIQYLLKNPEVYQKMSKTVLESIQPYAWDNLIKQYETYFERIYIKKMKSTRKN